MLGVADRPRRRCRDSLRGRTRSSPARSRCRSPASIPASCSPRPPTASSPRSPSRSIPLGRAREVSPTALFRDQVAPVRRSPRAAYLAALAVSLLALAGLAVGACRRPPDRRCSSSSRRRRPSFSSALVAVGVMAARPARAAACDRPMFRLAIGNIHRPGRADAVGRPLARPRPHAGGRARPHRRQFPPRAVRLDPARRAELLLPRHPRCRSRRLQGPGRRATRPTRSSSCADAARTADGDPRRARRRRPPSIPTSAGCSRATAASPMPRRQPPKSKLTRRRLVAAENYDGPPLVSFDSKVAEGLHLKLGDTITVNVLGREVTAADRQSSRDRVAVARRINFLMVFSPNTFRGAPFGNMATLAFPGGGTQRRGARAPQGRVTQPSRRSPRCASRRWSRPSIGSSRRSAGRFAPPRRSP